MTALFDAAQESAALAMLLRDYGRFIALGLAEQHFTVAKHQAVFQAARRLADQGVGPTFETVALELQRAGNDKLVGHQEGLLELRRGSPGTVLDPVRLRTLAALRAVRVLLVEGADLAAREDLTGALARIDEALAFGKSDSKVLDLRQLVENALEQSNAGLNSRRKAMYPGSDSLELAIGGFMPGSMYVLGALSNVGKSYVAQTWCTRMALRGISVGWVSLEDPELITGSRALGMLSGVEPRSIEMGTVYSDKALSDAISAGHGRAMSIAGKFLYTDMTGQTDLDVCSAMSVMAARGARIVVVDYIGVITSSDKPQDRRNEVREIAIRLKSHAKRLGVALLLLSQLTMPRDETGVAKEPSKYSLREASDLTNAAEVIIVAWREEESDDAEIFVKIAKKKSGGVGKCWTARRDPHTHMMEDTSPPEVRMRAKPKAAVRGGFGLT